jgi:serine protease
MGFQMRQAWQAGTIIGRRTLSEEPRLIRSMCALAVAGCLTLGHGAAMAQSDQLASGLIVKLKPSAEEGALQNLAQAKARFGRLGRLSQTAGYTSVMPWRHINAQTMVLTTPTPLTPALQKSLTDKLMATGQVAWVVPNVRQPLAAVADPNDPYYSEPGQPQTSQQQWWLQVDPYALSQWWLMSDAPGRRGVPNLRGAWDTSTGAVQALSARPVIAVLDTGITTHPDMPTMGAQQDASSSNILPGYDFVANTFFSGDFTGWDGSAIDPGDRVTLAESASLPFVQAQCGAQANSWHGSVVAGLIAAKVNNNMGVAGVNWHAQVMPVRVAGKCGADLADIVAGMYWAAGKSVPDLILQRERANATAGGYTAPATSPAGSSTPAKVVNISFGGSGPCDSLYQDAVDALAQAGVVVVAAAGNEHGAVARPGNCRGVVTVAALNRTGIKATYSNFGPEVTVSTVGGDPGPDATHPDGGNWGDVLGDTMLLSIYPNGGTSGYAFHAGTSYSAPIVSGVISLMLDVNPALSVSQIIEGLKVSSRPHVVSSLIGACSSQNPGRCICTTSTCGAGILDAAEALRYAQLTSANTRYSRTQVAVDLSTDEAKVASAISQAVTLASQDRGANVATASSVGTSSSGGGGGGGAVSLWDLAAALALLGAAGFSSRRQ